MQISIVTVFSELYAPFLATSLIARAQKQGLVSCQVVSLFEHVAPKERIDAPTFGHDAGMLLRPDVVEKAIEAQEAAHGAAYKVFFSPHGKKLNQRLLRQIAARAQEKKHIMLLPARYEGMDARAEQEFADEIISVGDFVLMGGDIPAMMMLEGMLRLVPGVVAKQESVEKDSFTGSLVEGPEYTAPVVWRGISVPEVVRSGNHGAINAWRLAQSLERTVKGHFAWLRGTIPAQGAHTLVAQVKKHIPNHYVALLHGQVLIGKERQEGTTSVTSIDIHDIARSSRSYGIERYFIVTPLIDQQRIVNKFLDFWNNEQGIDYNQNRHEAVNRVGICDTLDQVIQAITDKEGVAPLVITTSARPVEGVASLCFDQQAEVWRHNRPVLILFGTGQGIADHVVQRSDYLFLPIRGFSDFNHLSVRSAAAIILDRWLGINQTSEG